MSGYRDYNLDLSTVVPGTYYYYGGVTTPINVVLHSVSTRQDVLRSKTPKGSEYIPLPFETRWSSRRDSPALVEFWNSYYGTVSSRFTNYNITQWVTADGGTKTLSANRWNRLVGQVKAKAVGEFDFGIFLAEAPESLRMLSSTVEKLYRGAKAFRQGNFKGGAQIISGHNKRLPQHKRLTTPANAWLEYSYGWAPLVSDLSDAFSDFTSHNARMRQKSFRGTAAESGVTHTLDASQYIKTQTRWDVRKTLVVFVQARIPWPLATLADPRAVLWEKVPFSFVLDWFIPIGDYLEAASVSSSIIGTWVTSTKFTYAYAGFTNINTRREGLITLRDLGKFEQSGGSFKREISNNPALEMPDWKPIEKSASWRHCANALALLTGELTDMGQLPQRVRFRW